MLSVHMWGYFCFAYVCRSSVPVSVVSGSYTWLNWCSAWGNHSLGPTSVPCLPLRNLTGSSSRILGMMHFLSPFARLSPIPFQSLSILLPLSVGLIDSTSRVCLEYHDTHDIVASAWTFISHDNAATKLAYSFARQGLLLWFGVNLNLKMLKGKNNNFLRRLTSLM